MALTEEEIAQAERQLAALRLLREQGGKKGGGKKADPEDAEDAEDGGADEAEEGDDAADDGEGADGEMLDEDEMLDEESYAEGEGDDAEDEGDDDEEEQPKKARGKRGGGGKLAEGAAAGQGQGMTLAEQRTLQRELAEARYALYEAANQRDITEWRRGHFLFKEHAKGAMKSGRIALSRSFVEGYLSFMRTEGVRLSETQRTKLKGLVELALSTATIDLSQRGASYDPEGRMQPARRTLAPASDALQQAAERIALEEHRTRDLMTLDDATRFAVYERAAKAVKY